MHGSPLEEGEGERDLQREREREKKKKKKKKKNFILSVIRQKTGFFGLGKSVAGFFTGFHLFSSSIFCNAVL